MKEVILIRYRPIYLLVKLRIERNIWALLESYLCLVSTEFLSSFSLYRKTFGWPRASLIEQRGCTKIYQKILWIAPPILSSSTNSVESKGLAAHWLKICIETHTKCGQSSKQGWLPTRVLDVGSLEDPFLSLHISCSDSSTSSSATYISLSHCWGEAQMKQLYDQICTRCAKTSASRNCQRHFKKQSSLQEN